VLIAALAHLDDVRLTVVGGPSDKDLKPYREQADALGVRERCKFVKWEPQAELFERVRRAKAVVHPLSGFGSREWRVFTCPLKLLEGMALGTPVVATDLPAVLEIVKPGVTGEIAAAGDPVALAAAIRRVLDDPDHALAMALAAQRDVAEWAHDARAAKLEQFISGSPTTVPRSAPRVEEEVRS
jgi:glycosyltransferase involved in cell wall biosynthesis